MPTPCAVVLIQPLATVRWVGTSSAVTSDTRGTSMSLGSVGNGKHLTLHGPKMSGPARCGP